MTWQLHSAREHFPAFAAEWNRLNHEFYGGHPLFDSRLVGPLLEHSGTDDELHSKVKAMVKCGRPR